MSPEVVRVDRSTMGRTIKRAGRDDPPDGPEANGDEVGQRFDPSEAGRAIAFFNLLLFVGVFLWQWGFGVMVSALSGTYGTEAAYRLALGALALLSAVGYVAFVALPGKRPRAARDPAASPRAEGGTIR